MSASTLPAVTSETPTMRIGELAERAGVSVRSLRYYEQQDLLVSERTSGGQRVYTPDALDRVQLIQYLFRAGVPSRSVRQMLPCVYSGTTTPAMLALLENERSRIDEQARELAITLDRLDTAIEAARQRLADA